MLPIVCYSCSEVFSSKLNKWRQGRVQFPELSELELFNKLFKDKIDCEYCKTLLLTDVVSVKRIAFVNAHLYSSSSSSSH